MIETTHVRLEHAAKMLATDVDTLLIAAVEGKILLWAFVNALRICQAGYWEDDDIDEGLRNWVQTRENTPRHFTFVPVSRIRIGDLLRFGEINLSGEYLTIPDPNAFDEIWEDDIFNATVITPMPATRETLFMRRTDVQAIIEAKRLPDAGSIPEQPAHPPAAASPPTGAPTIRESSLLAVIAALMAQWPGGKVPSAKELETAAQTVGVSVSDDTIRKALAQARDIAPTLPPPK